MTLKEDDEDVRYEIEKAEDWKKWEEVYSILNEEEKRWWELLKVQLEGVEDTANMEGMGRLIKESIEKVETVLKKKLTKIPRKRRSKLWWVLQEGAMLLLIDKEI